MDPLWRNPGLEVEREREREREWDGFACIVSKGPTATDRTRPRRRAASGREEGRWALINGHSPFLPVSGRTGRQAGKRAREELRDK